MLDAFEIAAGSLKRNLRPTFVGDGLDRLRWEQKTQLAQAATSRLEIEFTGWLNTSHLDRLMCDSDLLVGPSLLPEPFGPVGPEAGSYGLPAAAFAVGGIPERRGLNRHLAPSEPPTEDGPARAIVACLRDRAEHARLRRGATETAKRFEIGAHISALLAILGAASDRECAQPSEKLSWQR